MWLDLWCEICIDSNIIIELNIFYAFDDGIIVLKYFVIYLTVLLLIANACWRANACQIITFLMKMMDFGWKFCVF